MAFIKSNFLSKNKIFVCLILLGGTQNLFCPSPKKICGRTKEQLLAELKNKEKLLVGGRSISDMIKGPIFVEHNNLQKCKIIPKNVEEFVNLLFEQDSLDIQKELNHVKVGHCYSLTQNSVPLLRVVFDVLDHNGEIYSTKKEMPNHKLIERRVIQAREGESVDQSESQKPCNLRLLFKQKEMVIAELNHKYLVLGDVNQNSTYFRTYNGKLYVEYFDENLVRVVEPIESVVNAMFNLPLDQLLDENFTLGTCPYIEREVVLRFMQINNIEGLRTALRAPFVSSSRKQEPVGVKALSSQAFQTEEPVVEKSNLFNQHKKFIFIGTGLVCSIVIGLVAKLLLMKKEIKRLKAARLRAKNSS